MCGICGTIGTGNPYQRKLLMLLNETRGRDACGILCDGFRIRIPQACSSALKDRRIADDMFDGKVWLAHTRAASAGTGGINKNTTHPFQYRHITGAHNGHIHNWESLQKKYQEQHPEIKAFQVDSQMIFFELAQNGYEGLKELSGYAAAWWVDTTKPNHVFLWINNGDLYICEHKDYIAFSSDDDHLKVAGYKGKIYKLEDNGQLVDIDVEKLGAFKIGAYKGQSYATTGRILSYFDGYGGATDENDQDDEPNVWQNRSYRCPKCTHWYQAVQINHWRNNSPLCPMCKEPMESAQQAKERLDTERESKLKLEKSADTPAKRPLAPMLSLVAAKNTVAKYMSRLEHLENLCKVSVPSLHWCPECMDFALASDSYGTAKYDNEMRKLCPRCGKPCQEMTTMGHKEEIVKTYREMTQPYAIKFTKIVLPNIFAGSISKLFWCSQCTNFFTEDELEPGNICPIHHGQVSALAEMEHVAPTSMALVYVRNKLFRKWDTDKLPQ